MAKHKWRENMFGVAVRGLLKNQFSVPRYLRDGGNTKDRDAL